MKIFWHKGTNEVLQIDHERTQDLIVKFSNGSLEAYCELERGIAALRYLRELKGTTQPRVLDRLLMTTRFHKEVKTVEDA